MVAQAGGELLRSSGPLQPVGRNGDVHGLERFRPLFITEVVGGEIAIEPHGMAPRTNIALAKH